MSEIDDDFIADRTFSHLNNSIKLADQKASILLSGQLAFVGLYLNFFGSALKQNTVLLASSGGVALSSLVGILFAAAVITPRTIDTDGGLFLWTSILQRENACEYESDIEKMSPEDLRSEVLKQNYHLSQIATRKYRALRLAILFSDGMVLTAAVSIGIWLT